MILIKFTSDEINAFANGGFVKENDRKPFEVTETQWESFQDKETVLNGKKVKIFEKVEVVEDSPASEASEETVTKKKK